ncbi:non-homologous end-joining DNA ligase [Microbispora triticiradicis]|uniref:non-homologous end-joining DNA ligase n=1 Tax=Microbispora triticiradicis TaxID=2200763 RepID=UPI001AD722B9|nr:non-homologous end-joining DNA ligase [Microbispora triticiradicis]MBO4274927.1 ATP-dependent DNA ligase [Microbispora triticiradicis]
MASPYIEIEVGDRVVKVTNPDKVYFPAIGATKRDLVTYYVSVGEGALRAMRERPTYLKRHPDGVGSEAIYQKRMPRHPDWIETVTVRFPSGRTADAFCPTEVAAIAWCANLGTIDFHPWHARRADLDHPDELRVDIDPQPGTSFEQARTVAFTAKEVLDELGMRGFPKTSGSRGVHVNVRIEPRWTFTEVRHAAIAFAREVERRTDLATTAWWKEERGEKVFIDYNQNARDRTVASAYSVRARPDGRVSAPVTWAELEDCDPGAFDLRTMPDRFAALGDVQREIDDHAFGIGTLLEWYDADERGDLPYPPNYPKMPGEPKRVQPSKARPSSEG